MPQENVYVGGFNLAVGLTDVKVIFLSVEPVFAEGLVADNEISVAGKITMSLPVAKQFCKQLNGLLDNFEKNYGNILDLDEESRSEKTSDAAEE